MSDDSPLERRSNLEELRRKAAELYLDIGEVLYNLEQQSLEACYPVWRRETYCPGPPLDQLCRSWRPLRWSPDHARRR